MCGGVSDIQFFFDIYLRQLFILYSYLFPLILKYNFFFMSFFLSSSFSFIFTFNYFLFLFFFFFLNLSPPLFFSVIVSPFLSVVHLRAAFVYFCLQFFFSFSHDIHISTHFFPCRDPNQREILSLRFSIEAAHKQTCKLEIPPPTSTNRLTILPFSSPTSCACVLPDLVFGFFIIFIFVTVVVYKAAFLN